MQVVLGRQARKETSKNCISKEQEGQDKASTNKYMSISRRSQVQSQEVKVAFAKKGTTVQMEGQMASVKANRLPKER